MNHLYVCGFNGFKQIQELENSLKSLFNPYSKHQKNKQDERNKNWQPKVLSEEASQQKTSENKPNSSTAAESNTRKRKLKEQHDIDTALHSYAVDTVKKDPFKDQLTLAATSLREICAFPENIVVEHAEMLWSRIGITVSVSSGDSLHMFQLSS